MLMITERLNFPQQFKFPLIRMKRTKAIYSERGYHGYL